MPATINAARMAKSAMSRLQAGHGRNTDFPFTTSGIMA
jgi:hypothetical protein